MEKKYIFTLIVYVIFIVLFSVAIARSNVFFKRKQGSREEALSRGYGYYTEEKFLGCGALDCSEVGEDIGIQNCIVNSKTGNYCIDENGEFSTKSVHRKKTCNVQCYSTYLGRNEKSLLEQVYSSNINGEVSVFNKIVENNVKVIDKNSGIDYTDYFYEGDKLISCIPDDFTGYYKNSQDSIPNPGDGINGTTINCSKDYRNVDVLRAPRELEEMYPTEVNSSGNIIKVCYDLNNFNQVNILNQGTEIPDNFVFPENCYKHSKTNQISETIKLFPDPDGINVFDRNFSYSDNSQFFTFSGKNLENLNNFLTLDGTCSYSLNGDCNGYMKFSLDSEITLVNNISKIETNSIENINEKIVYISTTNEIGEDVKFEDYSFTHEGKKYTAVIKDKVLFKSNTGGKSSYFKSSGQEYIFINNSLPLVAPGLSFCIDSIGFNGIGFEFNDTLIPEDDRVRNKISQINTFGVSLINDKTFSDFSNFYWILPNVRNVDQVLFTNNCLITGFLTEEEARTNSLTVLKNSPTSNSEFYYYGSPVNTVNINPGFYYPLKLQQNLGDKSLEFPDGIIFYYEDDYKFNEYYCDDKNLISYNEFRGTADVKINYKKTSSGQIYPCDLEILNTGTCYQTGVHSVGVSVEPRIKIFIDKVNSSDSRTVSLIRNGINNIYSNINEGSNYIEKKLKDYGEMISNQVPVSFYKNLYKDTCKIVLSQKSSVSKVLNLEVFKSPYVIRNDVKNYLCFNSNGIQKDIDDVTLEAGDSAIYFTETENYPSNGGVCSKCASQGVEYIEGSRSLNACVQIKDREGVNGFEEDCLVFNDDRNLYYGSYKNLLEPCLETKNREIKARETKYTGEIAEQEKFDVYQNYYTEEIKKDKIYEKNEELFIGNIHDKYYIDDSGKNNIHFFNNSVYLNTGQMITSVFNKKEITSDLNLGLGVDKVYNNNKISVNYSTQVTYTTEESGLVSIDPVNSGINFFYSNFQQPSDKNSLLSLKAKGNVFSNSLSRSEDLTGDWLKVKPNKPVKIQFGFTLPFNSNYSFQSRFFDSTLFDPWSDVSVGDYINPDFSYFNKFFMLIGKSYEDDVNNPEKNGFFKYILGILTLENTNFLNSSGEILDGTPAGEVGDYVVLIPLSYNITVKIYPVFEVVKIISENNVINGVNNTVRYEIKRNINNENTSLFYDDDKYVCFNLGKNETNLENSIINNFYKITTITRDKNYKKPCLQFNFSIPSITLDTSVVDNENTPILNINNSTGTSIKNIVTLDTPFTGLSPNSDELGLEYEKFNPFISSRYFKDEVISVNSGTYTLFSNTPESKLKTRMLSYLTSIKEIEIDGEKFYFINEFRENQTFLVKQIPLTFKVGDVISHYSKTGVVEGVSHGPLETEYIEIKKFEVIETDVTYTLEENKFVVYDYKCQIYEEPETITSGVEITNNFFETDSGISIPTYLNPVENDYQISYFPYNQNFSFSHLEKIGNDLIPTFNNITGGTCVNNTFLDYYKKTSENTYSIYSDLIRLGKLDVLSLNRTTLKNTNGDELRLVDMNVKGKPYGSEFLIAPPVSGTSPQRVTWDGYSTLSSFGIDSNPSGIGLFTSTNGLEIVNSETNVFASFKFKAVENYKKIDQKQEFVDFNFLRYFNENTKQYYKNFGEDNKFSEGTCFEIVSNTFYPQQNFQKAIIGNYYTNYDIILNESENLLYRNETSEPVRLDQSFTNFSKVLPGKFFSNTEDNFYTFIGVSGVSSFVEDYRNVENFASRNSENLPLKIKELGNGLGDCPQTGSYYNDNIDFDESYLVNFGVCRKIFRNLNLMKFDSSGVDKIISLGNTPLFNSSEGEYDVKFLEDVSEIPGEKILSQYIYGTRSGTQNESFYNKNYCVGTSSFVDGPNPPVPKIDLSNGLITKFIPNSLDSQDFLTYKGVSVDSNLISITDNFPVKNNIYFPPSDLGETDISISPSTLLGVSGVSYSGVSFSAPTIIESTITEGAEYEELYNNESEREIKISVKKYKKNIFNYSEVWEK